MQPQKPKPRYGRFIRDAATQMFGITDESQEIFSTGNLKRREVIRSAELKIREIDDLLDSNQNKPDSNDG